MHGGVPARLVEDVPTITCLLLRTCLYVAIYISCPLRSWIAPARQQCHAFSYIVLLAYLGPQILQVLVCRSLTAAQVISHTCGRQKRGARRQRLPGTQRLPSRDISAQASLAKSPPHNYSRYYILRTHARGICLRVSSPVMRYA